MINNSNIAARNKRLVVTVVIIYFTLIILIIFGSRLEWRQNGNISDELSQGKKVRLINIDRDFLGRNQKNGKTKVKLPSDEISQEQRSYYDSTKIKEKEIEIGRLKEKLGKNPDDVETALALSKACFLSQDFQASIDAAESVLKKDPKNRKALEYRASAYFNFKRYRTAGKYAAEALKIYPDNSRLWHIYAYDAGENNPWRGVSIYKEAIKNNPGDLSLYVGLADISGNTNDKNLHREGILALETAIAKFPNDPQAYVFLAEIYRDFEKNPEKAKQLLEKARKMAPDYYMAYLELGRMAAMEGKYKEADNYLEKCEALSPRQELINVYFEYGYNYRELKRYDLAEKMFKKAIQVHAKNPDPYLEVYYSTMMLGLTYKDQGRTADAIRELKKAISYFSAKPYSAEYFLAKIYLEEGMLDDAEKLARHVYDSGYSFSEFSGVDKGHIALLAAQVAAAKGKKEDAVKYLSVAAKELKETGNEKLAGEIKSDKYLRKYFINAGRGLLWKAKKFYEERKYSEAIREAEELVKENPGFAKGYEFIGMTLIELKQYDKARRYLDKALKINPDFSMARIHLGESYYEERRYEKAFEIFNEVSRRDPGNVDAVLDIGEVYLGEKKYDLARKYLEKAVEMKPEYFSPYNEMGNLCFLEGKFDEAETYYKKSLERCADYEDAFIGLGKTYIARGDLKKAEKIFKARIQANPPNLNTAIMNFELAVIYAKNKDNKKALKHLKEAVKQDAEIVSQIKENESFKALRSTPEFKKVFFMPY
jgi:tetratricopeptide (TPR) repeat protein